MQQALFEALPKQGWLPRRVLGVLTNSYESRYASSILQVELESGDVYDLLCKCGTSSPPFPESYRRGVGHEAHVYANLLGRVSQATPKYFGSHDDDSGRTWLFIEYLDHVVTVNRWPDSSGVERAADWLAHFHAETAPAVKKGSFLPRLDQAYYGFWANRALEFTSHLHDELTWLPAVLSEPEELFGTLTEGRPVVVHGEFYPPNVLFDGNRVYPVDWECCAIGPVELDLAFLTEGWPSEVEDLCLDAYTEGPAAGGPSGVSPDRLMAAKAYLAVRYLGHKPGLAARQRGPERLELLRAAAQRLAGSRA